MHDTALKHGRLFFELYWQAEFTTVVELGSYDVNGTLRQVSPPAARYFGLDLEAGPGVDIVVAPGAPFPFADNSVDAFVSSSAFEHDVCFWETFLEQARVVRPGGLVYVNAPSNSAFHRYPLDCWRFYPDAGIALAAWAGRRGYPLELLESFAADPERDRWADFVAVFRKPSSRPFARRGRIADRTSAHNIYDFERSAPTDLERFEVLTPDMRAAAAGAQQLDALTRELSALRAASAEEIAAARACADELQARLGDLGQRAAAESADLRTQLAASREARADLERAASELHAIRASLAWRLMTPLRWLRGRST